MSEERYAPQININRQSLSFPIQQVMLSMDGFVLESEGTFFTLKISKSIKIASVFVFFEAFFEHILQIELGDDDFFLPRMKVAIDGKETYYDFRFSKMCYQNEIAILWTVSLSQNIEAHFQAQQLRNEQLMNLESRKVRKWVELP